MFDAPEFRCPHINCSDVLCTNESAKARFAHIVRTTSVRPDEIGTALIMAGMTADQLNEAALAIKAAMDFDGHVFSSPKRVKKLNNR